MIALLGATVASLGEPSSFVTDIFASCSSVPIRLSHPFLYNGSLHYIVLLPPVESLSTLSSPLKKTSSPPITLSSSQHTFVEVNKLNPSFVPSQPPTTRSPTLKASLIHAKETLRKPTIETLAPMFQPSSFSFLRSLRCRRRGSSRRLHRLEEGMQRTSSWGVLRRVCQAVGVEEGGGL